MYKQITFKAYSGPTEDDFDKNLQIIFPDVFDPEFITKIMLRAETFMHYRLVFDSVIEHDSTQPIEMGYKPKYIIFNGENDDDELISYPFIFSNDFTHKDVAWRMQRSQQMQDDYLEVRGAGFIAGPLDKPYCFDRSESLNVSNRDIDMQYIVDGCSGVWTSVPLPELIEDSVNTDWKAPKPKVGVVVKSAKGIIKQGKKGKRWS